MIYRSSDPTLPRVYLCTECPDIEAMDEGEAWVHLRDNHGMVAAWAEAIAATMVLAPRPTEPARSNRAQRRRRKPVRVTVTPVEPGATPSPSPPNERKS